MQDIQLADIVGQVYLAALDEMPWSIPLCAVADFCGAENTALVLADSRRRRSTVVTPRADPEIVSAYTDLWWQQDPTSTATMSAPVGQVTTLADTGREFFLQSQFHNEFWRRSGLGAERMAANLIVGQDMFASLVLQTSAHRDELSEAMFERFSLLVPHFVRAMNLISSLYEIELRETIDIRGKTCAGAILADDVGRVVYADARAETLLAAGHFLQSRSGILCLTQVEAEAQFKAAIANCASAVPQISDSTRMELAHPSSGSPFIVEILPYRGVIAKRAALSIGRPEHVALLLLHDPVKKRDARIAALRSRYDLTGAEAALAMEMLKGDGRAAAADRCGISINTARTHLTCIFDKTGVKRQAELVKLLLD